MAILVTYFHSFIRKYYHQSSYLIDTHHIVNRLAKTHR